MNFIQFGQGFWIWQAWYLTRRITFLGIQGTGSNWFWSYLTDRKQKVWVKCVIPHCWYTRGLTLCIIYINDLLPSINTLSNTTIFADDTDIIIFSQNVDDLFWVWITVLPYISRRFTTDILALTLDKMNAIKVTMKNSPQHPLRVGDDEEWTDDFVNTKFLAL